MGVGGISPTRLWHWMLGTGHRLSPWQFEVILAASRAYAETYQDAKAAAPWRAFVDKHTLAAGIKAAFRGGRNAALR